MAQYQPHPKQVQSHLAFLTKGYKRGVLLFGRQCLDADTLVATEIGYKRIADVKIGDRVLSRGEKLEYKEVTDTMSYWVDTDPKPMIDFEYDGIHLRTTYDHPFKYKDGYVPIYQLAWGKMETSQRQKLQILCEQYGQTLDHSETWQQGLGSNNETSSRRLRVSQNGNKQENNQDAQTSSSNLDTESREQSNGESQERYQRRQQSIKPGMEHPQRERSTRSRKRIESKQTGRELNEQSNDSSSIGNEKSLSANELLSTSSEVQSEVFRSLGYYKPTQLETHLISNVTISESDTTYAITVEGNQNYFITEKNLEVHNTGKTYFAVNHSWLSAVVNQGRYFVVFKTYKQAHEVVWRQYVPLIPKELIYKKNEQDLLIEFHYIKGPVILPDGTKIEVEHDETKPRSTLQLLGSDQSDSHRGFRADGIIFDEYGDQDGDNFDTVYQPMFSTTNGWAIFMGTPRGYNHFYDLIEFAKEDENWFYLQATWRDSPYVTKEFMDSIRSDAEKRGMLSSFMQEYELEFRAVQGAVYPAFNREVHLIKPSEIPQDLTYYATIDFGWHTTACLIAGVDKDQTWYIIDEIYGKEETLDSILPRIRARLADMRIVQFVADSANRDAVEIMRREYPMAGVNKANDSKGYATGISLVTEKLKPRMQLVGPPKPSLYISTVCKNFVFEMEAYKFPEERKERNESDIPVKLDDHGPDALRYLFLHLKFGVMKDEKIPKNTALTSLGEYGI